MILVILYLLLVGLVSGNICPRKLYIKKHIAPKRQFTASHHELTASLIHCANKVNGMRSMFSSATWSEDGHCDLFKEAFATSELVTTPNTMYIHMGKYGYPLDRFWLLSPKMRSIKVSHL